jgi:Calcineurin-like phosphoesterase
LGVNIAIGDIHGALEPLLKLLETEHLIDHNHHWGAGDTHLIFLGDYMDRGPDGIGVIDTIMRLEVEAANAGGKVSAILGNHDVIMLEVHHFGDALSPGFLRDGIEKSFRQMWLKNAGGQIRDLERLEARHIEWLEQRPAMMKAGETLLMHADSEFYLEYGEDIESINEKIQNILLEKNLTDVDALEYRISLGRKEFIHDTDIAREFAARFGAKRIVHGHTVIHKLRNVEPQEVTEPLEYANGICVNVDHGLCYGGEGFAYAF